MPAEMSQSGKPEAELIALSDAAPRAGAEAFLQALRRKLTAAALDLTVLDDPSRRDHVLHEVLRGVLPRRYAVARGRVISSSRKLEPSPAQAAIVYDAEINAGLLADPSHTGFPIEVVYATIGFVEMLTPDSAKAALEEIADLRGIARRGKFYTTYVPLQKPNGKTLISLRELRLDSEPRTYLIARDIAGKGKWEKPEGLAKQLKEMIGDTKDQARLHGLAVLERDWFLYQPAYKKRLIWQPRDALLALAHKMIVDLKDYAMHPLSLDRYSQALDE